MAEPVLSISHLTKRFDDQTILEDLSLEIQEGEVVKQGRGLYEQ